MIVLAAVPGVSVLTVTARSAASGFRHGVFTAFGIIVGDIFFILLAVFGLKFLAIAMGELFIFIIYMGGACLIWLGIDIWKAGSKTTEMERTPEPNLQSSFMAGLLITLADQKAVLFYLGFFPAFLDLAEMTYMDALAIIVIASMAIGSVKLGYAYAANRILTIMDQKKNVAINTVAGCVMVTIGGFLFVKADLAIDL